MRKLACVGVMLLLVGLAQAAVDWEGDNNGVGDGWDFNNGLNWDDRVNPEGAGWNIHRRDYGYYIPFKAWDIHVTSDIATAGATMYDRVDYPVTVTVNENVNLTMTGELVLQRAQNIIVKPGASLIMGPSFDLANQQIHLGSTGGAYMKVESGGRAAAGYLRHNNGSVLDLYGTLRTWQITRIAADQGYAFNVYGGGLIWVEDMTGSETAWYKDGKITQYLCSTVQLKGDRTGLFENYVQKGEAGEWAVDYGVTRSGYTTIRLLPVDACDFGVSPTEINSLPGAESPRSQDHPITISNTMGEGEVSLNYTVVEVDRNGFVTDVPWLSVDKLTGGPVAPGGTDIVTVTVDYTRLEVGLNVARVRLTADCNPCFSRDVEIIAPFIMIYNGDVDPETPGAGGPGMTFTEREGEADNYRNTSPPALAVEPNALAQDGWELKIADGPDYKLKLRTAPSQNIGGTTGATIVGRVRTTFKFGSNLEGENLSIWHDGGGSLGCHWSGAGDTTGQGQGIPGYLKETSRGDNYTFTDQALDWYAGYHIIRACMGQVNGSRAIRIYFDENPAPVIEILNASNKASATDSIGFGTGSTLGQQVIYFDWVTGTNAGMFAPGEEVACIGRSLCLGPGCYESPCNTDVFADVDGDGDVDQADFAVFQICYTGMDGGVLADPDYCQCFDRRNNDNSPGQDNDVDSFDLAAFEDCASGPGVPANAACDD